MKNRFRFLTTTFAIAMSLIVLAPSAADAQLLNKLSKRLGKVNDKFERVTKRIEQVEKAAKKNKERGSSKNVPSTTPLPQNQDTYNDDDSQEAAESVDSEQSETPDYLRGVRQPTITPNTLLLRKKECYNTNTLNPVSDGIFALQETNRKYGYGYYFGFWTIDGKRLTDARYECADGYPLFDSGAVVVKDLPDAKSYQPFLIIYKDGTALRLPGNYRKVSQFRDGVATVDTKGTATQKSEGFCIDTKGKRIWRNLDSPTCAVLEVGHLHDGLRRVLVRFEPQPYRYNTAYGFINNNGEWVIKPDMKLAGEFKNGYCAVKDKDNNLKFIDTKGNTVCNLPDDWSINQLGDISDGYFLRQEVIGSPCTFYDLEGNAVKTYLMASDFKDGYAFIVEDYGEPVRLINTKFEIVRTVCRVDSSSEWVGINNPKFGKAGLGTIVQSIVVTPDGKPQIFVSQNFWQSYIGDFWQSHIGNFLPGDYAPATIIFEDSERGESYGWSGFVDKNGDFAVVITDDERAMRKLPGEEIDGKYIVSLPEFDTIPAGLKFLNN